MGNTVFEISFWIISGLIFYVYFGYLIILFLAQYKNSSNVNNNFYNYCPVVTLFIPVHNEESIVGKKIANSLNLDYPRESLIIVVASDGSTDRTNEIVKNYVSEGVILFINDRNEGKNSIINKYIPKIGGEIIIFTDANSLFDPSALKNIVKKFKIATVGCVGGRLVYSKGESSVAKGEGFYFKYENVIRRLEGLRGAMVGANGAIYAIRRELFVPVPNHVPNDFFHPLSVLKRKYASVYAMTPLPPKNRRRRVREEFKRRSRIVTRSVGALIELHKRFGGCRATGGFTSYPIRYSDGWSFHSWSHCLQRTYFYCTSPYTASY